jgi:hypothetical protein
MKRLLLVGAAGLGAGLCARRAGCARGRLNFEKLVDRMPEDAPPRWVFRNISAIRENTERILELLETERTSSPGENVRTAA